MADRVFRELLLIMLIFMSLYLYKTIARSVLLALYDIVDHKLHNFHIDLTNICKLLQNLLK